MEEKPQEAKKVEIEFMLSEVEKYLRLKNFPKKLHSELEKSLEHANFWNFLRDCNYLESVKADFHITGFGNPPAWHLYCKHPKNKCKKPEYIEPGPKDKNKITGACDIKNCPIYKNDRS